MILGYTLLGTFAGFVAFIVALFSGQSFLAALTLFSMVGASLLVAGPAVQIAVSTLLQARNPGAPSDAAEVVAQPAVIEPQQNAPDRDAEPRQGPLRILAVDDDPFILGLVPVIASGAGFPHVTAVASAALALDAISAADTPFDCLLLDINMPKMDGIELCRRIRNIPGYGRTPIIMLTGKRDMNSMEHAYLAGASDYATKPFDIVEFEQRLHSVHGEILERHSGNSAEIADQTIPAVTSIVGGSKTGMMDAAAGLVSRKVVEDYLTQLSNKELADVRVFAVKVNCTDLVGSRKSYLPFMTAFRQTTIAIRDILGSDRCMIADAGEGIILAVINGPDVPVPDLFEDLIYRSLDHDTALCEDLDIDVAVGRPVVAEGARVQRAGIAIGRAIGSAKNRALEVGDGEPAGQLRLNG